MRKIILLLLLTFLPAEVFCFFFSRGPDKTPEMFEAIRGDFENGNCASVLDKADAFLKEGPSAELKETAYQYMGRCYEREGLADKAISLYNLASGLYPENFFFAARLAGIYLDTGFYENAVTLFTKILAVRSDDLEANLGLARAYSRLGFLARAKTHYSIAVALTDFGDPAVLAEYASVMIQKRDWPEVIMLTEKGRASEPANAFWPRTLARVQAGKGDYKKAWAYMNSALKLSPENRPLALERALYLLLSGNTEAAGTEADIALAKVSKDPLASLIKAMAFFKEGKNDQARGFFELAARNGEPFTAQIAEAFLKAAGAKK
ncbi:MAG: tetratricopeptide repeat protein [Elusimicrobia bacterium]|nr:tetratricopeptide repeat protein [Elusimicrobiota bacterium]